jgi:predicted NUDIX family NTP pyrophosphohydrolase
MKKQSAGILLYRLTNGYPEVMLVHPGGPFWAKKDLGGWSIPKGEFTDDENPLTVAKREFQEETGQEISGSFVELKPIVQKGGKTVYAWAVEGDLDTQDITSNTFDMEWPPKSGQMKSFPEIDKAEWFNLETAMQKLNEKQCGFLDELVMIVQTF